MSAEFPYDVFLSHTAKDKAMVREEGWRIKAERQDETEPTKTTSAFSI